MHARQLRAFVRVQVVAKSAGWGCSCCCCCSAAPQLMAHMVLLSMSRLGCSVCGSSESTPCIVGRGDKVSQLSRFAPPGCEEMGEQLAGISARSVRQTKSIPVGSRQQGSRWISPPSRGNAAIWEPSCDLSSALQHRVRSERCVGENRTAVPGLLRALLRQCVSFGMVAQGNVGLVSKLAAEARTSCAVPLNSPACLLVCRPLAWSAPPA